MLDQRIINIDRGQRFFAQTFLEMSDKMLVGRITSGPPQMKKHQALFAREEKDFGVPASVITAFWALESDFGSGQGKDHAIKSLATLAYDCRRSEMFRGHLFDALRLIERGDLRADEMIGSWAGTYETSWSGASCSFTLSYDFVEPSWLLNVTHGERMSTTAVPRCDKAAFRIGRSCFGSPLKERATNPHPSSIATAQRSIGIISFTRPVFARVPRSAVAEN